MGALKNFFALNPVFTRRGLKILWFLYLLRFAVPYVLNVRFVFTNYVGALAFLSTLHHYFLYPLINLCMIRLLLEVAVVTLLRPSTDEIRSQDTGSTLGVDKHPLVVAGRTLMDFLALRPVFTPLGLKIFWYAFLFDLALSQFNLLLNTYQGHSTEAFFLWLPAFLLPPLLTLCLIRLLLEVADIVLFHSRMPERSAA